MQPRLKTSTRWTEFPKEYAEQIRKVFIENFRSYLMDRKLILEGRIYPAEILLRVGILEKGRLAQANFEVSIDYSSENKNAIARIHLCVDAAASMLADYIEQGDKVDFPRSWQAYPFEKETIHLKFTTENSELEAEADKLLGLKDDSLMQGEEAEAGEEDESDESAPKMFGGKGKKQLH